MAVAASCVVIAACFLLIRDDLAAALAAAAIVAVVVGFAQLWSSRPSGDGEPASGDGAQVLRAEASNGSTVQQVGDGGIALAPNAKLVLRGEAELPAAGATDPVTRPGTISSHDV